MEHKKYVAGGVAIILISGIGLGIAEFMDNDFENHKGEYRTDNEYKNENKHGKRYENIKDESEKFSSEITQNKISIPLNLYNFSDAQNNVISSNSGTKITNAFLENNNGVVNYIFILNNSTSVKVNGVDGKIINNSSSITEKITNSSSGIIQINTGSSLNNTNSGVINN